MKGYLRSDGRKGIRNVVLVAYMVECAHHVAREIAMPLRENDVHVIGWQGCYPNAHGQNMMQRLGTHPNVGAVLLVSLGCEGFDKQSVVRTVRASGRPVEVMTIQQTGGTRATIEAGTPCSRWKWPPPSLSSAPFAEVLTGPAGLPPIRPWDVPSTC